MTSILGAAKTVVKKTPLWPLLRPRRIHIYGVGAPKTGTVSLARLFANYRSGHEAHPAETLQILRDIRTGEVGQNRVREALRSRDRKWRLECESAHFLVHLVEYLTEEFPDAKFICTVREPRSWLRSILDQCINNPRSALSPEWKAIHDLAFGRPPEEYPPAERLLEEYGLRRLDQYLQYWAWHNEKILDAVPSERRLFIRTAKLSSSLEEVATFANLSTSHLSDARSHSHRTTERHSVLEHIENSYINEKIRDRCSRVVDRLNRETSVSVELP